MENNSKTYALVAWTENGNVRMVPSLSKDLENEMLEEIIRLKKDFESDMSERDAFGAWTMSPEKEIGHRIAISRAFEKMADYYLGTGAVKDARWALTRAALECADCSDGLWIFDENSYYPAIPLLRRFYAMHGRVLQLIKRYPSLRRLYKGSDLERDYLTFSEDHRLLHEEIREADAYRKGMRFGSR